MAHPAVGLSPFAPSLRATPAAAPRPGPAEVVQLHCARHGVTLVARRSGDRTREARSLTAEEPGAMAACVLARNAPLTDLLAMVGGMGDDDGEDICVVPRGAR